MTEVNEQIDQALAALRQLISRAVREEQLRDQLTGLPNDQALSAWIQGRIQAGGEFWVAFFEVDRFKEINDRYTYQLADALLVGIGKQLSGACAFFPSEAQAFRAHGDEFYLAGELGEQSSADVEGRLDHVRGSIARLTVPVKVRAPLTCTVSVGWLLSSDGVLEGERGLRRNLELAVSAAKHAGRDTIRRYDPSLRALDVVSLRTSCAACQAGFSWNVPRAGLAAESAAHCPNCGAEVARPPVPEPAESPEEPEI